MEWVSVKERLPDKEGEYPVLWKRDENTIASGHLYFCNNEFKIIELGWLGKPTHWSENDGMAAD